MLKKAVNYLFGCGIGNNTKSLNEKQIKYEENEQEFKILSLSEEFKGMKISTSLKENLSRIKKIFDVPSNFDFVIREFSIKLADGARDAFLIFYDGLVNTDIIDRDILNPLMNRGDDIKEKELTESLIYKRLISQAPLTQTDSVTKLVEAVGFGNCILFFDGIDKVFIADVKGWARRGVDAPITEAVLSGPQEAFSEVVMTNIALIRKILKEPRLIAENIKVGIRSNTSCALLYIDGVANRKLIREAKRRLESIDVEYIYSSTDVEMFIEDSTYFPLPQILKTERPDRAASFLADGKLAVIVQGSPFVLILPAVLTDFVEASEDNYVRVEEANFMRVVRIIGILLSLFLPGFFTAVSLYHAETIPTNLLLAITATREVVPFPIVFELIIMEISFELIKEASIRIPSPIGSTLGIVGGLILGQAAVSANLVSPILIIIVSIAGLGSFATPSVSLSRAVSAVRFIFIFLGAIAGFLGIAFGIFAGLLYTASTESFGVSYLAPKFPSRQTPSLSALFVSPIWKKERRPSELETVKDLKQPHISRKWKNR